MVTSDSFVVNRMQPDEIVALGGEFVVQYYTMMSQYPKGLHRFYKENSIAVRDNKSFMGQRSIHDELTQRNHGGVHVGILRLNTLRSSANTVLVQVSGEMGYCDTDKRRFVQSFVLQEHEPCDFYVINDIFSFQDNVYGDVSDDSSNRFQNTVYSDAEAVATTPTYNTEEYAPMWAADKPVCSTETEEPPIDRTEGSIIKLDSPGFGDVSEATLSPQEDLTQKPCTWAQMASRQPARVTSNSASNKLTANSSVTKGNAHSTMNFKRGSTVRRSVGNGRGMPNDAQNSSENRPNAAGHVNIGGRGGSFGGPSRRGRGVNVAGRGAPPQHSDPTML